MQQKPALPPLTKDLVDAFAASATLWLVRLLGLLFHPRAASRKRLFTRLVQCAERCVEYVLFITAGQRLGVVLGRRRTPAQIVIPTRGFRVTTGSNRLLWKSARIKLRCRNLIDRVARLLEALGDPERFIAHYMKRLAAGLCFRRLGICAPPADRLASLAVADVAIADSS